MRDARTAIREIVGRYGQVPGGVESVGDDDDLVELGMTSHATVNVMLALEEQFDFEFPEELLTKQTFESISSMLSVVSSLVPA
jgi:acyl carrier protein